MNIEKFTDRARDVIMGAQALATQSQHQYITPWHLASSTLDDPDGYAQRLLSLAGVDADVLRAAVMSKINTLPKVGGQGLKRILIVRPQRLSSMPANWRPRRMINTSQSTVSSRH